MESDWPPLEPYYEQAFNEETAHLPELQGPKYQPLSLFDVNYPTPEQCRKIIASSASSENEMERISMGGLVTSSEKNSNSSSSSQNGSSINKMRKRQNLKMPKMSKVKIMKESKRVLKNKDTPAARRSEENQRRKEKMCFPKHTFVLRYVDLQNSNSDYVWCVDNHQLLLKYVPEESKLEHDLRTYTSTVRYAGWLCDEYWEYFPLDGRVNKDGDRITVDFPSLELLHKYREQKLAQHQTEQQNEMKLEAEQEEEEEELPVEELELLQD